MMDEELEAAIDAVGRDRVFARAQSYGWNRFNVPPKWVWWCVVRELQQEAQPQKQPQQ